MKRWKKNMALILSFVMVIAGLNLVSGRVKAAGTPQFVAEPVTALPGEEIQIPVRITGNTGIMGLGLNFKFDKKVLTPIDDIKATSLLAGQFNDSVEGTLRDGTDNFDVKWGGTDEMSEDGELFTLKFKVSDSASGTTEITPGLLEDDTYDGTYTNVAVACPSITVTVSSGGSDEPTEAPKPDEPTKAPIPTGKPDEPTKGPVPTGEPGSDATAAPGEYWDGQPVEVYLDYESDADYTESIDGMKDGVLARVDGDGEYAISFVAKAATANINSLSLATWLPPQYLPVGMKIVPTQLWVGNTSYPIGECVYDDQYGLIRIRDFLYDVDCIAGKAAVPVNAGDTVKVIFRVGNVSADGTQTDKPILTEPPRGTAAPGETVVPGNQSTKKPDSAPTAKPDKVTPGGKGGSGGDSRKRVKPGRVKLKSVKRAGKRVLVVRWKRASKAYGYNVQYALNRRFTRKKKTTRTFATREFLFRLKSKKTYYVRVRAFSESGRKGAWSKVKKCKVK